MPPAFKRIRVDEEGTEVGAPGRGRLQNVDITNKTKALRFIFEIALKIYGVLQINLATTKVFDVVLDSAICNLIYNLHQARRQEFNAGPGTAKTKFSGNAAISIDVHGVSKLFQVATLRGFYEHAMNECGFTSGNYSTWGGNVQTILTILTCFGERLKELRIMPVGIVVGKKSVNNVTETQVLDFKKIGVKPQHRQYCSGAGFKPFVKSGIAQSLGCLTQVSMLSIGSDDKFSDKWVAAVCRTFAYIPEIEAIARVLKVNKPSQNHPIVTHLANIAMIAGGREQRRMTPPLSAIMRHLLIYEDEKFSFGEEAAKHIDFSGKGAFSFYKTLCESEWEFTLNVANTAMSQQLLFHAMFGTYVEDFGVLYGMTNYNGWAKRADFSTAFPTMKASAPMLTPVFAAKPMPLMLYSKLASATLFKEATTTTQATNASPIFAGYRVRKFTNEMSATIRAEEGRSSNIHTVAAASTYLQGYVTYLLAKTEERDFHMGTVTWHEISGVTPTQDGPPVQFAAHENGQIYWSS